MAEQPTRWTLLMDHLFGPMPSGYRAAGPVLTEMDKAPNRLNKNSGSGMVYDPALLDIDTVIMPTDKHDGLYDFMRTRAVKG